MAKGDQGLQVVIDPQEWFRLKQSLDKFDKSLTTALRKRIKNAGNIAADSVRKKLALSSPGGGDDSGESRAALIAATRVTVSFAKRAAGAKIVTGSGGLDAAHKGLLKVYNKTSFRHPVFGNTDNWVPQKGRPYFNAGIYEALNKSLVDEIRAALDEATRAIGAKGI